MTKKKLLLRIKVIKDTLTLANLYPEEFEKALRQQGIGFQSYIDSLLDELKALFEELEKM